MAALTILGFTNFAGAQVGIIEVAVQNVTFTALTATTGTISFTVYGRQGATYYNGGQGGLNASNLRCDLVVATNPVGTFSISNTSGVLSSVNSTILTGGVTNTSTVQAYAPQGVSPTGTNASVGYTLTRNNYTDPDLPSPTSTRVALFTATYSYTVTSGSTPTLSAFAVRTNIGTRGSSWSGQNNATSSNASSGNGFTQGVVALPIDLTEFDATNNGDGRALLNWETASEQNSSYFEVERSVNGDNFNTVVSKVRAAGKSSSSLKYQSYDLKPVVGANYYRLKMVDLEGKTAYSAVRKVIFSGDQQGAISVYPTDNHDGIVNVSLPQGLEGAQIKVINAAGQVINAPADGIALMRTVNIAGLPAGIYMLQVADKGVVQSFRVSYQH